MSKSDTKKPDPRCPACRSQDPSRTPVVPIGDTRVCTVCSHGLRAIDRNTRRTLVQRGIIRPRPSDVPLDYITIRHHSDLCTEARSEAKKMRYPEPACAADCQHGQPWPTLRLLPKQLRELGLHHRGVA